MSMITRALMYAALIAWSSAQTSAAYTPKQLHTLFFGSNISAGFAPADATTYYWGSQIGVNPATVADSQFRGVSPVTGTVAFGSVVLQVDGTLGSSENITHTLNNITAATSQNITTTGVATAQKNIATNSAMTLAVTAGDKLQMKMVTPTWATNPTITYWYAMIVIRGS